MNEELQMVFYLLLPSVTYLFSDQEKDKEGKHILWPIIWGAKKKNFISLLLILLFPKKNTWVTSHKYIYPLK